jgi:hypothetical protein
MAAGDGLVSMTPTSIAHSGTSASINADGGVDFTAVTSLSLNGVFTSEIDNYLIVVETLYSVVGGGFLLYRMRASGTDNTTASSYVTQYVEARSATVSGGRFTQNYGAFGSVGNPRGGQSVHVYGPFLAQPTASRSVNADGFESAYILDTASTHNQSTSYDGFTIYLASNSMAGNVHVFGYEE